MTELEEHKRLLYCHGGVPVHIDESLKLGSCRLKPDINRCRIVFETGPSQLELLAVYCCRSPMTVPHMRVCYVKPFA